MGQEKRKEKMIYLDNAATTKPYQSAVEILTNYNLAEFYNPSSVYLPAFLIKQQIKQARNTLSQLLHCKETELTFTSGATEGNNFFLQGIVTGRESEEYIFSLGEHSSTYEVANLLKQKGSIVHFVSLKANGQVNVEELLSFLNQNTRLVSVMHVNNETGAINDIKNIVAKVKQINPKTLFHCDGVQAFGKIEVNVKDLGVDSYIISAHKIHAPKGVGAIFIKSGVFVKPLILGGGQEENRRSGTENVGGILAMVHSAEIMNKNLTDHFKKVIELNKRFVQNMSNLEGIEWNRVGEEYSPYILSMSVRGIKGEILVHSLENEVLISTGSSCSSNQKHSGNRVLQAMGFKKAQIEGNIRISFSEQTTIEEIDEASKIIGNAITKLKQKMGVK